MKDNCSKINEDNYMQNLVLPDKEDFRLWFREIILKEIKPEFIRETIAQFKTEEQPQKYKTSDEICAQWRISKVTLNKRDHEGLPSIKVGKKRVYDPKTVERFFVEKGYK